MSKNNFSGFNNLKNKLESIQKNAEQLAGNHSVNFTELFTTNFMEMHTNCSSFDEFLKAGNFIVNSKEDFEAIPNEEFDSYVRSASDFSSWTEMQKSAIEKYVSKKLGF